MSSPSNITLLNLSEQLKFELGENRLLIKANFIIYWQRNIHRILGVQRTTSSASFFSHALLI